MAVWRDPLDELIEGLERTLPAVSRPSQIDWQASLIGCQLLVHTNLYGTPEDIERIRDDPRVQAFFASLPAPSTPDSPTSPTGDPQEPKPR